MVEGKWSGMGYKYLLLCGRYIERNPVKAGMINDAWEYPYSSARFYVAGVDDGITRNSPLFTTFGDTLELQRLRYKDFLRISDPEQESVFSNAEFPLGSQEFIKRLIKENGRFLPKRQGRIGEIIVS